MNQKIDRNAWFFIVMIFILILKPAPGMLLGSSSVMLSTLAAMLAASLLFFLSVYHKSPFSTVADLMKCHARDRVIIFFGLTILSFTLSTMYGMLFVSDKTGWTDFQELYRYVYYIIFYLAAKNVNPSNAKKITAAFVCLILIVEGFGVMQFYNFFNINHTLGLLYTMSDRHLMLIVEQNRIPSTLLNPNMYGSFLIIVAALLLAYISLSKNIRNKWVVYALLALTIFSVLLTTSRTAVFVLAAMIAYWFFVSLIFGQERKIDVVKKGALVTLLYVLIAFVSIPQIGYLNYAVTQIYQTLTNSDEDSTVDTAKESLESVGSFKNRYYYWNQNLEQFKKSPVLGSGPMKENFVSFADHSYLYILARYGFVGLAVFLAFNLFMYGKSISAFRKSPSPSIRKVGLAINMVLVSYFIMGFVSEVWFNLQSMTFFYALLGLLCNQRLKEVGV